LSPLDLRLNPFPQLDRMWLPHACWPPSPASILNQISNPLGIPIRFLFLARCSSLSPGGEGLPMRLGPGCDPRLDPRGGRLRREQRTWCPLRLGGPRILGGTLSSSQASRQSRRGRRRVKVSKAWSWPPGPTTS
jgi:hypothetical protein